LEAERRAFRQAVAMAGLDPEAVADLLQIDLDYAKKRLKEWFFVLCFSFFDEIWLPHTSRKP